MKMTTETGITCPNCNHEFEIETEGFFGGIFKQMLFQSLVNRAKTEGGDVTCGICDHKFYLPPQ